MARLAECVMFVRAQAGRTVEVVSEDEHDPREVQIHHPELLEPISVWVCFRCGRLLGSRPEGPIS